MLNLLNWDKPLMVNGEIYQSSAEALEKLKDFKGEIEVKFNFTEKKAETPAETPAEKEEQVKVFRFEVKQYMTKKASPGFDFMRKWNDDKPMPLRVMYGEVLEETRGMLRVRVHGRAEKDASACSHCLRPLTNEISKIYGIGPICGGHGYFASDYTKKQIENRDEIFKQADAELRKVIWEGWIIKSAIQSQRLIETKKLQVSA
jgi:hypothetical protein